MKVVQINSVCGVGSTGRIAVDISKKLSEEGIENFLNSIYNGEEISRRKLNYYTKSLNHYVDEVFGKYF